jgi:hypothetical protein
MHVNPLYLPTLLLAGALYAAGLALMRRVARPGPRAGLFLLAVVLAVPGALFSLYYLHWFDGWLGFYQFRAMPFTELTAAGMGVLAGMVQAVLPKKRLFLAAWVPAALVLLLGWLSVPYAKMLLTPLAVDPAATAWADGVCLQSTGATCGPASAATLLRALGIDATEAELARESYTSAGGTENWYLARALRRRGCAVAFVQRAPGMANAPVSAIAGVRLNSPTGPGHFIVTLARYGDAYTIADPLTGPATIRPAAPHGYHFTGFYLVVRRQPR